MKFNEKLQKMRKEKNYSQEQLADLLEVSRQSVSKWESGATYPEMEKLLTLCKTFNCSLEQLTNEDISLEEAKERKPVDNILSEIKKLVDKSVKVFMSMDLKSFIKFLVYIFLLVILLAIFRLPFEMLAGLPNNSIGLMGGKVDDFVYNLWRLIINIFYTLSALFLFIYIYKEHLLNHFHDNNKKEVNNKNNIKEKIQEEKFIYKQPSSPLDNAITTLITILAKFFAIIVLLPGSAILLGLLVAFGILVGLFISGIWYFGAILLLLSGILLGIIIIEGLIRFLFNKVIAFKRSMITLLIAIIIFGVGITVTFIDAKNTTYIDAIPKYVTRVVEEDYEITMSDDLLINSLSFNNEVTYVKNDSLEDKVLIKTKYYDEFVKGRLIINDNIIEIFLEDTPKAFNKVFNIIFDSLKEKEIYNYNLLGTQEVIITTSSKNIEVIKNNLSKYLDNLSREEQIYYYEDVIDDLEEENSVLRNELEELNDKLDSLRNSLN